MKITMAHGSGGKASAELMDNIFKKYFSNDILDKMEDSAVLEIGVGGAEGSKRGKMAFTTDSFVVDPIVFKGGNIGKLAVCGTVNDLLSMGAEPRYLSAAFILEEGLALDTLDQIVSSMAQTAKEANVNIVCGDTKVVEGKGGLYINTSGIGFIPDDRNVRANRCREGDTVIVTGTLGDHHACILSARMGIENNIESDCAVLKDIAEALFEEGINVKTMRDITRGGLGTILNEIAQSSGVSIEIEETALPAAPDVKGFCGLLGLDPIYMGNEGKFLVIVDGREEEKALRVIRRTENGKDGVSIGKVQSGKGVHMITRLGGRRKVDVLQGEGLPRIC